MLPSRLSLTHLFEAIQEAKKNIAVPKTSVSEEQEKQKEQLKAWLLTFLRQVDMRLKIALQPDLFVGKGIYLQFASDAAQNRLETGFSLKELDRWSLSAGIPLQLTKLFSPGLIDLTGLSADFRLDAGGDGFS
ncbi:MAG TPA: hypothetical protein DF383_12130, partial [Deltaproteobacteria bacterium]|nr:hypothetical protein [Deltaproteobacteria bacterium]